MNATSNPRATLFSSVIALALCAGNASASTSILLDCGHRTLPSQALAGAWAGTENVSAAYHARVRLMAELDRACRRQPGAQVEFVLQDELPGKAASTAIAEVTPR